MCKSVTNRKMCAKRKIFAGRLERPTESEIKLSSYRIGRLSLASQHRDLSLLSLLPWKLSVCVALVALSRFIIHAIAGSIISTGFGFHSFVSRDSLFQRRCDLERTFSMRKSGIVILSREKATHKFISVNCIAFDLNHAHFTLLIVRLAISYRISYISFICVHKVRTESLFQIDTIFFSRFRR